MTRVIRGAATPSAFLVEWAEGELREALRLDPESYEIFAQGSRVNNTYLDPASDIDLVLMLRMPSGRPWTEFRDDVLAMLGESYSVRMGRRCLNVDDPDSLFGEMVDVLVATEHRRHSGDGRYEQGVFFRDQDGHPIVNFPKQHRRNGDEKDLRTGGTFKDAVRTAKRARRLIPAHDAPSYLLECLLYNVPDHVYRAAPPGAAYRDALGWLSRLHHERPAAFAGLPCQNGLNRLFGPAPDQWEAGEAGRIIDVLHAF